MDDSFKIWKKQARRYQQSCCDSLGDRFYDRVNEEELSLKVGFALYNQPSEINEKEKTAHYSKAEQTHIKLMCDKIKAQHAPGCDRFYLSCVCVVIQMKNKKHTIGRQILFKVPKLVDDKIDTNSYTILDPKPRVYDTWKHYLKKNKLPKCDMCLPRNGTYTTTNGMVDLDFAVSPACKTSSAVFTGLDMSSTLLLIGATGVSLASLAVPIAAPVVWGAAATVVASGSYETVRTVYRLHDIKTHSESLGFNNPDARRAWLNLAGSIVGMASIGATAVAKGVLISESAITRTGLMSLRILNVSSLALSGMSIMNGIVKLVMKRINGTLETKDIVKFIYVCLFFVNASISYQLARILIEEIACSFGMTNILNLRENTNFQIVKDIVQYRDINCVSTLAKLITGVKPLYRPDINRDDLECMAMKTAGLIFDLDHEKITWTDFCINITNLLMVIWKKYEHVIEKVIHEIQISFDIPYWHSFFPKEMPSSNLEVSRLICNEIDRIVNVCGILYHSNEHRKIFRFAREFSSIDGSYDSECEFINRFQFYCDCIEAQFKEEKEIYEVLFDSQCEKPDFDKDEFDLSFGIKGRKEDFFFNNTLNKVNQPDFLNTIAKLYDNLSRNQDLNTHLPFLQTEQTRIYTFCGPDAQMSVDDDFFWDKARALIDLKVDSGNCIIRREGSFIFIQPKEGQDGLFEFQAILMNTSFTNNCLMGLLMVLLK